MGGYIGIYGDHSRVYRTQTRHIYNIYIEFQGPNTIISTVFGTNSPIMWVLGPLGTGLVTLLIVPGNLHKACRGVTQAGL